MATVQIEGKNVTLPDDVVKAGPDAIRAVLASNGFPGVEKAEIKIVGGKEGAPAIVKVSPRAQDKGADLELRSAECGVRSRGTEDFIDALASAPEYVNPAIALAAEAFQAEAQGDVDFIERVVRSGQLERAVAEGEREGAEVMRLLAEMGHVVPGSSKTVPVGF